MTLKHDPLAASAGDPAAWSDDPTGAAQGFPDGFGSSGAARAAVSAPAPPQVLYLQEPGTASPISVSDLFQGQIGDCFLIASIGEMALNEPAAIQSMIRVNANGTETVTLHVDASGRLPGPWSTAFKTVAETVAEVFPNYSADNRPAQDVANGRKEIWPQVIEKAVAQLDGGYGAIANGGNPTVAMEELTGRSATFLPESSVTLASLQAWMKAGDLITFDTGAGAAAYHLVGRHAYMFEGLTTAGGAAAVKLGNPWGFDQPSAVPLSQLSRVFVETDVGKIV